MRNKRRNQSLAGARIVANLLHDPIEKLTIMLNALEGSPTEMTALQQAGAALKYVRDLTDNQRKEALAMIDKRLDALVKKNIQRMRRAGRATKAGK